MPASHPEVAILPSLPPSPSFLEAVFSYPRPWSVSTQDIDLQGLRRFSTGSASSLFKGKGKQAMEVEDEEDEDEVDTQHASTLEAYPPTTDEVAETRRVEETLKRWEFAERQRRKAARESVHHISGPSLLSSVTRTASLVISGRNSIGTSTGPGNARTFKSHETINVAREGYAIPLDDIDHTRLSEQDIAVHSPSASLFDHKTSSDTGRGSASGSGTSENPFVHPSERTTPTPASTTPPPLLTPVTPTPMLPPCSPPSPSPFENAYAHARQAVQGDLATRISADSQMHARKPLGNRTAPVLPPRLLGLFPPPRATQPQPTSHPVLRSPQPRRGQDPEERQEVRWWHDWLCGCSESPDRGGDNQAGRTNPFE